MIKPMVFTATLLHFSLQMHPMHLASVKVADDFTTSRPETMANATKNDEQSPFPEMGRHVSRFWKEKWGKRKRQRVKSPTKFRFFQPPKKPFTTSPFQIWETPFPDFGKQKW